MYTLPGTCIPPGVECFLSFRLRATFSVFLSCFFLMEELSVQTLSQVGTELGMYDVGVQALCDRGVQKIPDKYIIPEHDRPCAGNVVSTGHIPVIDMSKVHGVERAKVLQQMRCACEEWGVFQLINHDFPENSMQSMMEIAHQFFELPAETKMQYYCSNPSSATRYGISYNAEKEKRFDWRDFLFQPCHPLSDELVSTWPDVPPSYREIARKYAMNIRTLALRLLAMLSESLGLYGEYLAYALKEHEQKMLINHYPPCPQPDLTLGVSGHTDPNIITVLQQDEVGGLQVLRDGLWVAVHPIRNAFVINMGDQMQIISNGKYQCVEHRAVVNSARTRFSIASFYGPSLDAIICPAPQLIDQDHPPQYHEVIYGDYLKAFRAKGPNKKAYLQSVLIK
ncbi:hypothetical protein O6H91_15G090100 [Diphasiastrum complanatum]|uniref:Uncharacterized protein n=1 Tax=Diphasiastrum complanatum TaxID=34168 RepID=A0ACC2BKN7_DIPCM|nr:hypothetical protein O6H91_15G090100 [Diphasiastrum complanatum]